jgi:hypothetical protein
VAAHGEVGGMRPAHLTSRGDPVPGAFANMFSFSEIPFRLRAVSTVSHAES